MHINCPTSTTYVLHIHKNRNEEEIGNLLISTHGTMNKFFTHLHKYKQPSREITGINHSEFRDLKTCMLVSAFPLPANSFIKISKGA